MMKRQIHNTVRLNRCLGALVVGLLLLAPPAQADTDQLQKALTQTEASIESLTKGDAQEAAVHAEAAKMHLDIAARDSKGITLQKMELCKNQLSNAEQLSRKNQPKKAKFAAGKALIGLKQLTGG